MGLVLGCEAERKLKSDYPYIRKWFVHGICIYLLGIGSANELTASHRYMYILQYDFYGLASAGSVSKVEFSH